LVLVVANTLVEVTLIMDAPGLRERIKATLDTNANTRQAAEQELKAV